MERYKQTATSHYPGSVRFSMFTADDIRKISVKQIITGLTFDKFGHPLSGGLYDPVLGAKVGSPDPCVTCGYRFSKCTGHFGHIELPLPVVNPLFHKILSKIFKLSCLHCFTLQIPTYVKLIVSARLILLRQGQIEDVDNFDQALPVISDDQNIKTEYIRGIIDAYMQKFFNKIGRNQDADDEQIDTKNSIAQSDEYLENILKRYVRTNKAGICINCHEALPKISSLQNKIIINNKKVSKECDQGVYKIEAVMITPKKSKDYLRQLWNNEKDFFKVIVPYLASINTEYPTDTFFFEVIPVIPSIARPASFVDGYVIEHPQTRIYATILETCLILTTIIQVIQDKSTKNLSKDATAVFKGIKGNTPTEKLQNTWQILQYNANHLMDRDMNKTSNSANSLGLKQILEKKQGIIRKHMMGKRVDFSARSVITPDPYLNIDEIGVPEAFALELTYPVTVTPWNFIELGQLVLNGPDVHPGAIMVKNEDGILQAISSTDYTQRAGIAKCLLRTSTKPGHIGLKVVYRHLQTGDMLLVNRQPTLHKPSIMAHKARVLKGDKTLHLHYANCKAYNADFDGDEINIHFPQDEVSRSEAYNIASVSNQYLVPRDGSPLTSLIQDYIISAVRLTTRGKFVSKDIYMQLVYNALAAVQGNHQEKIHLLPPCFIKPEELWSGKQVVSTVMINVLSSKIKINLISKAKIKPEEWQIEESRPWKCGIEFENPMIMSESEVIIRHGELLCGVLDKAQYNSYGLIHCVYELYGNTYGMKMINAFSKLFQTFLQYEGFSFSIEDLLLTSKAEKKRRKIIKRCRNIGDSVQRSVVNASDDTPIDEVKAEMKLHWNDPKFRAQVDQEYKNALEVHTDNLSKTCLKGLSKKFPRNNMQLMVQSGAKGSTVNITQISCNLGQIELEGKRPPLMMSGKSLPSFSAYDSSPRAGGFIDDRFLTGIRPQECFFHCMAGREGLIDTAIKTSTSGYLQRCLVKHLEGVTVGYDGTVRDSDSSIIQFHYGEDGLDIPRSRFLNKEQLPFLIDNKDAILDTQLLENLKTDNQEPRKMTKKIKKWQKKNGSPLEQKRSTGFLKFCDDNNNMDNDTDNDKDKDEQKVIAGPMKRAKPSLYLLRRWSKMTDEEKKQYNAKYERCPDPVMSKYRQDIEFGVVSERLENTMDEYLSHSTAKINKSTLRDIVTIKNVKAICQPGESVGLLAAQSIGEPSTQMTLNTFHFAGCGEMNMTLGVPRLREILMHASKNIKTPSMEIPFRNRPDLKKQVKKLKLELTPCILQDIIEKIHVSTRIKHDQQRQLIGIKIEYLPRECYKKKFSVHPKDIIKCTEEVFIKNVFKEIKNFSKTKKNLLYFDNDSKKLRDENAMLDQTEPDEETENISKKNKLDLKEVYESSDEEQAADDTDATSHHRKNKEYEDPEEEEEEEKDEEEEEEVNDIISDEEKTNDSANKTLKIDLKIDESNNNTDEDDEDDDKINNKKNTNSVNGKNVIDMYPNVIDYKYDKDEFLWCHFTFWLSLKMIKFDLPTVLKNAAQKTILYEIPGIKKAFTLKNSKNETVLKTDGFNIAEIFKYGDILDFNRLYSNDIQNICQTYGIEAAYRVIVEEIKNVFKMYAINVDIRHLSLIADYMTYNGTIRPLSRQGMKDCASPLQQMSFENAMTYLKDAILKGKKDNLSSPSSRLMLGELSKQGTGAFSLLTRLQLRGKEEKGNEKGKEEEN